MSAPVKEQGLVFSVQRFCMHDGPGIRTVVFFKGCSLRCAWCQNPEGLLARPELAVYAERCIGCGDCVARCPSDALSIQGGAVQVDWAACTHCGDCVEACETRALTTTGERVTAPALAERCLRDAPYYEESGGGVTLSGGEPVLHPPFLERFLRELRSSASGPVHVLLETAGQYPWSMLEPLVPLVDAVYFDWKPSLPGDRERLLGVRRYLAPETLRRLLLAAGLEDLLVKVRIPLVPGLTDSPAHLEAAASQLSALGVPEVQILSYHGLWEAKLRRLDTTMQPLQMAGRLTWETVQRVFQQHGVTATPADSQSAQEVLT